MTGEPCPDTPCELCGDVTPGAARYEDPDRGWDALCLPCWQLQQPPEPTPLWPRWSRRQPRHQAREAEAERAEEMW